MDLLDEVADLLGHLLKAGLGVGGLGEDHLVAGHDEPGKCNENPPFLGDKIRPLKCNIKPF